MNTIGSLWNKWDLHIHTDASDGKGSCEEILREAKSKGIRCIAVTDHHTVGNVDIMKQLGASMDIVVISGVEFRTEYERRGQVVSFFFFFCSFSYYRLIFSKKVSLAALSRTK